MDGETFLVGFLGGLTAVGLWHAGAVVIQAVRNRLGEDEIYLLNAARAAGGRLIFRYSPTAATTTTLQLKEFAQHRPMDNRGQVDRLVQLGYLVGDESGVAGRFHLTPQGWARVQKLPHIPLVAARQGAWYDSISRRPARPMRR